MRSVFIVPEIRTEEGQWIDKCKGLINDWEGLTVNRMDAKKNECKIARRSKLTVSNV